MSARANRVAIVGATSVLGGDLKHRLAAAGYSGDAVALLDADDSVNFEYEGEMAPDAALNPKVMALYPFSRLSGPANVLILPGLQSANLSAKLLRELGGETTIGPLMIGSEKPVQIAPMTAIAPDVLTLAVLASAGVVG